jgi:hypothetical protein
MERLGQSPQCALEPGGKTGAEAPDQRRTRHLRELRDPFDAQPVEQLDCIGVDAQRFDGKE